MPLFRITFALLLLLSPSLALDFDNDSLRQAVNDWLEDPVAATTTYGVPIGEFEVWKVTDMSRLFQGAEAFNEDLSSWDTHSVTDMHHMFAGAVAFNSDLKNWRVSQVTDFSHAFYGARNFTGETIGSWDTSSAVNMEQMFLGASSFVGPEDIENWNLTSVTSMYAFAFEATSFDRAVNGWNLENCEYTNSMFEGASSFSQKVCWPRMNPHGRCFQCFCGTNNAGFDLSSSCEVSVHPSIVAYSQACDPDDILEDLVENQVFGRPQEGQFLGGLGGATGSFVDGVASLPMLSNPSVDEEEEEGTEGSEGEDSESEQTGDFVVVAGAQREIDSAACSWRTSGVTMLLVAFALATRWC